MSTHPSITNNKTSFLVRQIRLLSTPLQQPPSTQQEPSSQSPSDHTTPTSSLSPKALSDLTGKLNAKIKSHNRLVFSTPSQRHVAEQIDALYWNEISSSAQSREKDTLWIPHDLDLTECSNLASLPERVEDVVGQIGAEERERYTIARERAVELANRRDELRKRVEGYRALRGLLGPFEDVRGDVQPNLVTKDGELSREMERMRVLVARVEAGVGRGQVGLRGNEDEDTQEVVLSEKQKLAMVMGLG